MDGGATWSACCPKSSILAQLTHATHRCEAAVGLLNRGKIAQ
jgi:hypothetical protein